MVESGGFAKAAVPLSLTPSAVSKAIARLEQRLGARLFARSTRSIRLTEAGEELYARAQSILVALAEAEAAVGNLATDPSGDLHVTASDAFATQVIVPMLGRFQQDFPRVRVHLAQGDGPYDLVREEYDLAIRFEEPSQKGLGVTTLVDDPWVVCAAPDYLAIQPQPAVPADLMKHRCLAIRARDRLDNHWQFRGGRRHDVTVSPVFSGIGLMVRAAALQGLGVARLARFLVNEDLKAGRLVPLLEDYQIQGRRKIYAVTPDRGYLPAKTRVFLAAVKRQFGVG